MKNMLINSNYRKIEVPIRELLLRYGEIDVQPVGQRLDTEPQLEKSNDQSKAQGIINSIMMGVDLGQITIHEKTPGSFAYADTPPVMVDGQWQFELLDPTTTAGSMFAYESVDGGHRKRYIFMYFNNKFRWNGMYYSDLSPEQKKKFLETNLTFCIYSNLSIYETGYIFRSLNETTDVNHQEMLNSYGDIPIANAIRNTVRPVRGVNNKIHSFFEFSQKEGKAKVFNAIAFDNKRLRHDEMIARVFYRYYDGGGLGKADDVALEELYESDLSQKEVDKIYASVKKLLNFVEEISTQINRSLAKKMNQTEFSLFSRIWLYMEEEFETFKVNDYAEFYEAISTAYAPFTLPYDSQPAELRQPSPWDANKTRGQQFKDVLGYHRDREPIFECLMWLLKSVDMASLVTLKDPKRIFPRAWREAKLIEQGFKCAISGEPLTMADAHGAHKTAHAEGGLTTYDNLAMVSAYHNKRMGSMTVEQYTSLVAA